MIWVTIGLGLNCLVGLLVAIVVAGRSRQHWLRRAPNFLMFVLGLELWPVWGTIDLIAWYRNS